MRDAAEMATDDGCDDLIAAARCMALSPRRTLPAPSPLVGEGWGGGWFRTLSLLLPPSLSLPRKGGGNRVAGHCPKRIQSPRALPRVVDPPRTQAHDTVAAPRQHRIVRHQHQRAAAPVVAVKHQLDD